MCVSLSPHSATHSTDADEVTTTSCVTDPARLASRLALPSSFLDVLLVFFLVHSEQRSEDVDAELSWKEQIEQVDALWDWTD